MFNLWYNRLTNGKSFREGDWMAKEKFDVRLDSEQIEILKKFFERRHGAARPYTFSGAINDLIALEQDHNGKTGTTKQTLAIATQIRDGQEVGLLEITILLKNIEARMRAMEVTLLEVCDKFRGANV